MTFAACRLIPLALLLVVASCGGSGSTPIEGSFDVGGRVLYLECRGGESPTVVYLHGYIEDSSGGGRMNWASIPELLSDQYRVCTYDRANVGLSDSVPGRQTGTDSVRDLEALLAAAEVPGPYVLLGGSFGGEIAYMYAATYPENVAGMVLLDPALPGDHTVFELIPKEQRTSAIPTWDQTLEHLDDPATSREAVALRGSASDIPVTLIATKELEFDPSWPVEKMTALIRSLQRGLIAEFSQGRLIFVDVPHYMEPEIPDRIAAEVERVIDAAQSR